MIPDEEIARLRQTALAGGEFPLGRALARVLEERDLLVIEHESRGPDRKPAHDAVERFK